MLAFILFTVLMQQDLFGQGRLLKSDEYIPEEKHLQNIRMLTFEGENAEAYLSYDNASLVFQRRGPDETCDQIYVMDITGNGIKRISNGKGRTTCSFFLPDGSVIYATTAYNDEQCPPPPDMSKGYVWPLYPTYDIVRADTATGKILSTIIKGNNYDAEATVSPDGKTIVYTSIIDDDIELFTCNIDGSNIRRITNTPGYDGGAFFSPNGKNIVFRASRPEGKELENHTALVRENLVRPSKLDIYVMNTDGTGIVRVTNNGAANFAPFMHPDGKRIIFCSNMDDKKGRNFDLYLINVDGSGLERVTYSGEFDGFPMFTSDGKKLVFCSNRLNKKAGDTNVFIADWID
jgi:Tol biopolymer transport system component